MRISCGSVAAPSTGLDGRFRQDGGGGATAPPPAAHSMNGTQTIRRSLGRALALAAAIAAVGVAAMAHETPRKTAVPSAASSRDAAKGPRAPEFDYEPPRPGTYRLPPILTATDGTVLDTAGKRLRLRRAMDGKIALLSLIYTQCGDASGCPLATSILLEIYDASASDRELAENLRLVSLSFDPARDTPAALASYAAPFKAAPDARRRSNWTFLTTASESALAPILEGYDQVVQKNVGTGEVFDGTFTHMLQVYLIDRAGQIRNIYSLSFLDPRLLIADVKTLLMEERRKETQ